METEIYTVTRLTREIKNLLESQFPLVWVEGEISNFRMPSSGHFYFVLKDKKAQIRAVMFRHQNQLLRFSPEDGMAVICLGRLSLYEPRGEYQIILERLEPMGQGALQLAFEQLLKKLQEEGLFDESLKQPLPFLPRRVVVITSPTGAALRDFIHVMDRRYGAMDILIYPVRVQGAEAAGEIAEGLDRVNAEVDADVIVLTRGGGSLEDLWPFNEEVVARAIFRSRIPVLSAVGHEIDFTISDFVADKRAPTPSVAAEILSPLKTDLLAAIALHASLLDRMLTNRLGMMRERLENLALRVADPRRMISEGRLRVDDFQERLAFYQQSFLRAKEHSLERAVQTLHGQRPLEKIEWCGDRLIDTYRHLTFLQDRLLERCRKDLQRLSERLNGVNPLNVLERGYSITTRLPQNTILLRAGDVKSGDKVRVRLHRGTIRCAVERVEES